MRREIKQRADNVTGLLGGSEFRAYLYSQKEPISAGFLMHISIDDFRGSTVPVDMIMVTMCLTRGRLYERMYFGSTALYRLVGDQYIIVDLRSHSMEDAAQLEKKDQQKNI